jgi:hypothetical protein
VHCAREVFDDMLTRRSEESSSSHAHGAPAIRRSAIGGDARAPLRPGASVAPAASPEPDPERENGVRFAWRLRRETTGTAGRADV